MNKKQLIVVWVLALWLGFAVVYSSYYPGYTSPERVVAQGKLTFNKLRVDPEFLALPSNEQRKVLIEINSAFAGLPVEEQINVIVEINRQDYPATWEFHWDNGIIAPLSLPAILIAIPLFITFRNRR